MARDKLWSVEELASVLGLSENTVYTWVSQGRLPFVKLGTRTMFLPEEIERWLKQRARHEGVRPGRAAATPE